MYKKKVLLLLTTMVSVCSLGIVFLTNANNMDFSNFAFATSEPYSISMSSTKNKLFSETGSTPYSGNSNLKTGLGNDINFTYYELMGLNNTWHVLKDNGYFRNTDAINGMNHINVTFKNSGMSYKLYWSYDTNFSESKVYNGITSTESPLSFDFNSEHPAYLKFINISGSNLNISAVNIIFNCSVASFNVSAVSEDVNKGTVSGSGNYTYGSTVTLIATPRTGYDFYGWYVADELVSINPILSFSMDDNPRSYIAKFVVAYKLFIYSEDENHGIVSAPVECGVGKTATIIATGARGYSFNYWYDEDLNIVSNEASYSFVMPDHDVTLYAGFFEGYRISLFSKNSEELALSGDGVYLVDSEVTVRASLNYDRGYFIGWFDNGNLLSSSLEYTFICEESLSLEARWHNLKISNNVVTGYNTISRHVYVPSGVTSIGYMALRNCSVIETIDIPNTVTSLSTASFEGCSSLQSIDASSITSIADNVFKDCSSLSSIVLSDSLTSINYQSFSGCSSLSSITLPAVLTSIEQGLFRDCITLVKINFKGTMVQWNNLVKEANWRLNVPATCVYCSDGIVYF